jgi:dTDP-4-amino-4,6-dideoxygalactose transaminase
MNIPFIDLKAQYQSIKNEIDPVIQSILDNASYVLGESVTNFENDFCEKHNVKYCIGTSSGTDANHLASWALGIGSEDEVILPANTFIATAWGVTLCGAKPVFVDCNPESYNIDPEKVESAITSKTKAIIAVHLYGQPADMDPLQEISNKYGLYLIEDAAQAHLAEYKGKKVGGLSEVASFSFYPGKNLGAYGEAGAITTNKSDLSENIRMRRDHGMRQKYYHEIPGHNYRMDGIQGAVLGVKLNYLDNWTNRRRNVADKYRELLSEVEQLILPEEMDYGKHVYHLFVVRLKNGGKQKRDELQKHLNHNGIATGLHYPIPLHSQKCFSDLGYQPGDFPNSEMLANNGISLPIFPEITDEQINYICNKIKLFFT